MAKWLVTEKNCNQIHCKSLTGQGLAHLNCVSKLRYQISLTKLQSVVNRN